MQQYRMVRLDDLNGSEKDVTEVSFSFDGETYRLDLGPKSRQKLEKALAPFIDAAKASSTVRAIRSAPPAGARAASRKTDGPTSLTHNVREWAKKQGIEVSDRGRLPNEIIAKYDEYEKHRTVVG